MAGPSWEGFAIKNILDLAGGVAASFYRTSGGAEVDLVLTWPDGREWAIGLPELCAELSGFSKLSESG